MSRCSTLLFSLVSVIVLGAPASAQTVVFWQKRFSTVGSQPITQSALAQALGGPSSAFTNLAGLHDQLQSGSNLLLLGG